ncbi:MAG: hypothetical protein HY368_01900 [Candidatus Aenigmarchaeota archaeon]|nr:hypothetical protein [Candidatus Aenigmarchaeota archaeon]
MMNNGQNDGVQIIFRGNVKPPPVLPGMLARYEHVFIESREDSELSPEEFERLTILRERYEQLRENEALGIQGVQWETSRVFGAIVHLETKEVRAPLNEFITRVRLGQFGDWYAYHGDGRGDFVSAGAYKPLRIAGRFEVQANDVYEIEVNVYPGLVPRMLEALRLKKQIPRSRKVLARVLAPSDLSPNPLVYLTDLDGTEVYAILLDTLRKFPRKGFQLPAPRKGYG